MASTLAITPDVAGVLSLATVDGMTVRLVGPQLDRKLYQAVDKVLTALGGKWDRRQGGHVFPFDPAEHIARALGTGEAVHRKNTLQFFQTPAALAERMARMAGIERGDLVLEPEAGHGRLVAPALALGARVIAIEIDPVNVATLKALTTEVVIQADFLVWAPDQQPRFDVALMNPPFTAGQDIDHIRAAWRLLAPGGRLVSICSESSFASRTRKAQDFRDWASSIGAEVEVLPAGTFSESGTPVTSRLIFATSP